MLMLGGIVAVAVGAGAFWLHGGRYVSVDDAYVQAAKEPLSTDVSGIVAEVPVKDGQLVHKGDVLLRLDPRRFEIALAGARADLAATALRLEAMQRDYQRMLHDVEAKQSAVQSDQASFDRAAALVTTAAASPAPNTTPRASASPPTSTALASLRSQAEVQLARLGGKPDADVTTPARLPLRPGEGGRGGAPARRHAWSARRSTAW